MPVVRKVESVFRRGLVIIITPTSAVVTVAAVGFGPGRSIIQQVMLETVVPPSGCREPVNRNWRLSPHGNLASHIMSCPLHCTSIPRKATGWKSGSASASVRFRTREGEKRNRAPRRCLPRPKGRRRKPHHGHNRACPYGRKPT